MQKIIDVVEGTVYTILVRLEKNKLVETAKKPSDIGPPRKFFRLNDAGRNELALFWKKWGFIASKLDQLKGEKAKDLVGGDVSGFCDELIRVSTAGKATTKEKLNQEILQYFNMEGK